MENENDTDDVGDLLKELDKPDEKPDTGLLIDLHKPKESVEEPDDESSDDEDDDNESEIEIKEDNSVDMTDSGDSIMDKTDDSEKDNEGYDPEDSFKTILSDAGLKRGVKAITESFFNGAIDSPDWLNYVLMEAGIGKKQRNLILMSY